MGYLTTVTFRNDCWQEILDHPREAIDFIYNNKENGRNINSITVQRTRHADDHALYFHWGNTVTELSKYNNELIDFCKRSPEDAKRMLKCAKEIIKDLEKEIKEIQSKKALDT